MVVADFYVFCVTVFPYKTDAPLVVDTNAVLARSSAPQRFEPITRRNPQVVRNLSMTTVIDGELITLSDGLQP